MEITYSDLQDTLGDSQLTGEEYVAFAIEMANEFLDNDGVVSTTGPAAKLIELRSTLDDLEDGSTLTIAASAPLSEDCDLCTLADKVNKAIEAEGTVLTEDPENPYTKACLVIRYYATGGLEILVSTRPEEGGYLERQFSLPA